MNKVIDYLRSYINICKIFVKFSRNSTAKWKMYITKYIFLLFINDYFKFIFGEKVLIFKGVSCDASEKYLFSNFTCTTKFYGSKSTITLMFYTRKPMNFANVILTSFLKFQIFSYQILNECLSLMEI